VKLTNGEGAKEAEPQAPAIPAMGEFGREESAEQGLTLKKLLMSINRQSQSMRLVLTRNASEVAVYIHEGRVIFAESGKARAEKALYRAFEWRSGTFRVEPFPANDSVPRIMSVPIETLVEEGAQQAKELDELLAKLPPPDAPLRLREGSKMRICDFTPAEIEVFQGLIAVAHSERQSKSPHDRSAGDEPGALLVVKRVFEMEENSRFSSRPTSSRVTERLEPVRKRGRSPRDPFSQVSSSSRFIDPASLARVLLLMASASIKEEDDDQDLDTLAQCSGARGRERGLRSEDREPRARRSRALRAQGDLSLGCRGRKRLRRRQGFLSPRGSHGAALGAFLERARA
jgi:hypothetical protein